MSDVTRTITQIAVATSPNRDVLYALADDGTVWRLAVKTDELWLQLPALPAGVARQGLPP